MSHISDEDPSNAGTTKTAAQECHCSSEDRTGGHTSYPCTSGPFCSRVWRASWAAQSPNFSRRTGARPSSSSVSVLWSLLCGQYGRGIIMGGEGNGTRCIATTRSRPLPTTLPSLQHVDIPTQELELVGSSRPTQELAVDPHKNSQ